MSMKRKQEGGRLRGAKSDLINYDHRNEANPLKQEVAVRKGGGLFLAPNGVKVEIPPGASSGRRERLLCAAVPSSARGMLGPWLGPNLRMASDMQLFFSPQNFRSPVFMFIPFSCAATRELTYPIDPDEPALYDTKKFKVDSAGKENNEGDSVQPSEVAYGRVAKTSVKLKQSPFQVNKVETKPPDILDTRSVFLLCCRLGENRWDIVEKFTVVQPTTHHTNWPHEIKRLAAQTTRWQDTVVASSGSSDANYTSKGRMSSLNSRTRRTTATPSREVEPLEQIRRMENFCGGLVVATDELCHLYLAVIGSKAENFSLNRDGALIRSSLLHPFLSVRVPKRSCLLVQTAHFKVIEVRLNWSQLAGQFDPQMNEVEGCSDIYELDLHDVVLRRPAIVRIPLPQWFIERRTRSHDNWDQNSITVNSSEPQEITGTGRFGLAAGTYTYDKPLMLLYQPPGSKRQIVWQTANVEDVREDIGRRKSRFQVSRKDALGANRCKIENLYSRLGWSFLTVGVRGSQWYTMKQPLYFTKRTAFFETSMLGRFVLISARDPERTPASKLAHLMSRVEALSAAPPGALVIFLQLQPTCWKIMAKLFPEDRLADHIQEHVAAGFVPLVQMTTGPLRRSTGLCNSLIQATDLIQMFREPAETQKLRKPPPVRVNGGDINHVLMYNGLCLEFRITGDVRQKRVNQFEPMAQVLKFTKHQSDIEADSNRPASAKRTFSLSTLGEKVIESEPKPDLITMLTSKAYLQHHELLQENTCAFEIEPILPDSETIEEPNKFMQRSFEKLQLVTEGLRASAKRQEHDSEDYEEDEEENEDMLDSEEEGLRRSFSSLDQPSAYDGNDDEVDEFTQEAQERVLTGQPLSVNSINSELLRRVNNVLEKNKLNRSGEFLQRVHDLFHIGTLEVWMVAPESLPQLAPPTTQKAELKTKDSSASVQAPSEPASQATEKGGSQEAPSEGPDEVDEKQLHDEDEEDDLESVQEAHNATRWNPTEATATPDLMTSPNKPLAVYNLLIDPDLVLAYKRSPTATVAQKKTARGKSPAKRAASKRGKQGNANAVPEEKTASPSMNGSRK